MARAPSTLLLENKLKVSWVISMVSSVEREATAIISSRRPVASFTPNVVGL